MTIKRPFLIVLSLLVLFSCKRDKINNDSNRTLKRICFGSCSSQHIPDNHDIFNVIAAQNPDLYIAGGDNIYGDFFAILPGTLDYMQRAYASMWNNKAVRNLYDNVETIATWDDHDFGMNDGVIDNSAKYYAKDLLFKYFKVPADDPRRFNPSGEIYRNYEYGDAEHRVQCIMLDLRWSHTPYKVSGPVGALSGYDTIMDPNARMMSDEQWAWLEEQFRKPAKFRIIMSSLQFSASYNGGEAWSVLPLEKQRMVDLIKSTRANGIVFLSGDVHFADLNVLRDADCYPLFDFSASGLTHYTSSPYASDNRIPGSKAPFAGRNFGQIDINWDATPIELVGVLKDEKGNVKISQKLTADDLSF